MNLNFLYDINKFKEEIKIFSKGDENISMEMKLFLWR
jgi:hypothetical protein